MKESTMTLPRLLRLVDYHDPILRSKTIPVQFPLSEEDRAIIRDMKYSIQEEQLKKVDAPWQSAAGMAANQWGINKRIFLYCPVRDSVNHLETIINPTYEILEPANAEEDTLWEGCFSVPLAVGYIKRYKSIRVRYQNEDGQKIEKTLSGWNARVWQHENDHLDGLLYDDHKAGKCLDKRVFVTKEEVEQFYKTR